MYDRVLEITPGVGFCAKSMRYIGSLFLSELLFFPDIGNFFLCASLFPIPDRESSTLVADVLRPPPPDIDTLRYSP